VRLVAEAFQRRPRAGWCRCDVDHENRNDAVIDADDGDYAVASVIPLIGGALCLISCHHLWRADRLTNRVVWSFRQSNHPPELADRKEVFRPEAAGAGVSNHKRAADSR
jgi:hypothetical protein